jgi:hypothetical protein
METRTREAQHTPGPWFFGRGAPHQRLIVGGEDRRYVASVTVQQVPREMGLYAEPEREANARLIRVAPELLSIARRLVALPSGAWHPERHATEEAELIREARAAIARATAPTPEREDQHG